MLPLVHVGKLNHIFAFITPWSHPWARQLSIHGNYSFTCCILVTLWLLPQEKSSYFMIGGRFFDYWRAPSHTTHILQQLSTTTKKIWLKGYHILYFLSIPFMPLAKSIGWDNCKSIPTPIFLTLVILWDFMQEWNVSVITVNFQLYGGKPYSLENQ